jgi:hypothetical protein
MRRVALLVLLAALGFAAAASGERVQQGDLILSLHGSFSPLTLPRNHKAPVSVHLDAGLTTADHSILPRVTRIELGMPGHASISTRGLPTCSLRRLRNTTTELALESCRSALIGSGRMVAQVKVPEQAPFTAHVRLLAFNGRVHRRRAVIVHGLSSRPPSVVVLPFLIERRPGRFGTVLVAHVSRTLGPWPRFARFEIDLSRRYSYGGRERSYVSASCPIPKIATAGFASVAQATLTVDGGRRIGTAITRSCRAR